MKKYIIIIICIGLVYQVSGQAIKGFVYEENESKKKIPLIGANVYLIDKSVATSTDVDGSFNLHMNHLNYPVQLITSFIGYESDTLTIKSNTNNIITITLKKAVTLKEVHIEDERSSTFISTINPIQTQLITSKELTKAACCNLSESFQTNASIDANYPDAVSGTKQIKLLGLDGIYSQIMLENIPFIRGLSNSNGMSMIPGTWIDQISVSKGSGSVVNGFESMTGQINIDIQEPASTDILFLNLYGSDEGRLETNVHTGLQLNNKTHTNILAHTSFNKTKIDHNDDGFLDSPLTTRNSVMNRWHFDNLNNREGQIMIRYYQDERKAGQKDFNFGENNNSQESYGIGITNEMIDLSGKLGFSFRGKPGKSVGNIFSFRWHSYNSFFGNKLFNATQYTYYYNFIFDNINIDTRHKIRSGVSLLADVFEENFNDSISNSNYIFPGIYSEYTFSNLDKFTAIVGLRGDYLIDNSFYLTPRLHLKYDIKPETNLRFSAGRGLRNPRVFAESSGLLASSRNIRVIEKPKMESSWNSGISINHITRWWGKSGYLAADYFYTVYQNQIIKDIETFSELKIYNLDGESYSHAFQIEIECKPIKRITTKLAYKRYIVRSTFNGVEKDQPLISPDRFLAVLDYASLNEKWEMNITYNGYSPARIPEIPTAYSIHKPEFYSLINTQLTYKLKMLDIYGGVENVFDYTIGHPIIDAANPDGTDFDATLIWGPIMGRIIYGGIRFTIENKNN